MPTILFEDALQELFTDLHHSKHFADGKEISDALLEKNPAKRLSVDQLLRKYYQNPE